MDKTILRKNNTYIVRLLAGLAIMVATIICGIKIVSAIQRNAITVAATNGNITVNGNDIDDLSITPALVFNNTGDSITYQVTLSDPDQKPFQIKNISDDNTNQYINTSYDYDHEMNGNDKTILMTLTYQNYIPLGNELGLQDIHITIDIEDETASTEDNTKETSNNPSVITPNTGASTDTSKYLTANSSFIDKLLLPSIIIFITSIAIVIIVLPKSEKHRVQFGKIASIIVMLACSGIAINTHAASTKLEITIFGTNISAMPDTTNPQEVVSVTFPNIYNNKVQDRTNQAQGNAIILKTLDDKYVLMDTGPSTSDIRDVIYDTLKDLQGSQQIVIDYLVLSHLDSDHYGNATWFIYDSNITFKNIVLKHEGRKETTAFKSVVQAASNQRINIITNGDTATRDYLATLGITDYDTISEGMTIEVGDYLKLDFFNTADVYAGKACPEGLRIDWTANTYASNSFYKTANNEFVYIDGSEYQTRQDGEYDLTSAKYPYADVTLRTTPSLITKNGGSGMNRYFYASISGNHNICVSNPNAFGILAEVTTAGLNKYMYFPGDLENAGYGRLSSGANSAALYEDIVFEDSDFKTNTTPYAIPSEDNTAAAIYDKLASDANSLGISVDTLLNNIVLYQESHHGANNSEKAVWKLNLNRSSGIYAIEEGSTNMINNTSFAMAKTYWYTLGNLPSENKIRVGAGTNDGVSCSINIAGTTTCAGY